VRRAKGGETSDHGISMGECGDWEQGSRGAGESDPIPSSSRSYSCLWARGCAAPKPGEARNIRRPILPLAEPRCSLCILRGLSRRLDFSRTPENPLGNLKQVWSGPHDGQPSVHVTSAHGAFPCRLSLPPCRLSSLQLASKCRDPCAGARREVPCLHRSARSHQTRSPTANPNIQERASRHSPPPCRHPALPTPCPCPSKRQLAAASPSRFSRRLWAPAHSRSRKVAATTAKVGKRGDMTDGWLMPSWLKR
jgi:hypothetical protein